MTIKTISIAELVGDGMTAEQIAAAADGPAAVDRYDRVRSVGGDIDPVVAEAIRKSSDPSASLDAETAKELNRLRAHDRAKELREEERALEARGGEPSFAMVGAAELAVPVPPMEWLVQGVWPRHSFGPMGGEKKTLKSYNLLALSVAVASGEALFGEFAVHSPGPVLYYVGEGGQGPFQRRLQAIARAFKVELGDLPVHAVFEVGSLSGVSFTDALKRNLDTAQPELVIIDPLYAFHPPGIEAQNLYERGRMLAEVSASVAGQAALVVADHFKKSGNSDLDLDSISQAGMGQWADSWILQKHREKPDLDAGDYRLAMEFGSRQWGGRRYDLDWHLPPEGQLESGEGASDELSWSIRRSDSGTGLTVNRVDADDRLRTRAVEIVTERPYELTANKLADELGGQRKATLRVIDALVTAGVLDQQMARRQEGNRVVERSRLGMVVQLAAPPTASAASGGGVKNRRRR
ncbi:AAA family ATPase [Rhodococcus sp. UNC23MFCrub1.1]|uniref:AAA family ATPase n=1 Tax=Rhodococcus sp. UNC23MFCrub1.1 TaxID=1449068 RepID=UPI000486C250|nr:AAA family ATPase [Rhodococcus sp. UNC23MFCrub1.1]